MDVVCALIERRGRLLVAQRAPGKSLAGKWEFPGGKIDPGETTSQAIIREIREELGCEVEPLHTLRPSVHAYPTRTITLYPVVCLLRQGEPMALEHAAVEWVSPLEVQYLDLAEADFPVLADYLRMIESGY